MSECRVGDVIAYQASGLCKVIWKFVKIWRINRLTEINTLLPLTESETVPCRSLSNTHMVWTSSSFHQTIEQRSVNQDCLSLQRQKSWKTSVLFWERETEDVSVMSGLSWAEMRVYVITCKCKQANSPATVMIKTPTEKKYKSPLLEFSCKNELPGSTCPVLQHLYVRYEVSTLKATILFNVLRNRNNNVKCFLCCFSLQLLNFLKQCCHKALPPF